MEPRRVGRTGRAGRWSTHSGGLLLSGPSLLLGLIVSGLGLAPSQASGNVGPPRVHSAELRSSDSGTYRLILKTRNVRPKLRDQVVVYRGHLADPSARTYAFHGHGRIWVLTERTGRGRRFIDVLLQRLAREGMAAFKAGGFPGGPGPGKLHRFVLRGLGTLARAGPLASQAEAN